MARQQSNQGMDVHFGFFETRCRERRTYRFHTDSTALSMCIASVLLLPALPFVRILIAVGALIMLWIVVAAVGDSH